MIFTSVSLKILVIVVILLFDPALVQPSWFMDYPGTWECPLVIGQNVSMKLYTVLVGGWNSVQVCLSS